MGEQVGGIFYDVDLDTTKLIASQRNVDAATKKVDASLTSVSKATKTLTAATELQGKVSRDLAKAQTDAAIATARFGDASNRAGLSAKAMTAATRQLPAQFTDIFTGLASGQSPMSVFIQQGGQIKDVFGGVGPALRAVGGYVLGLLNPVTLAIAALSALGLGFFKGSQEGKEFNRAIELSGNASGVTADQLSTLAARMGGLANITRGQAAGALAEFVSQGVRGGAALGKFAEAAIRLEKAGGPAIQETAKAFAALGRDPLNASVRLNESTNFLTVSLYKQIKALEQQGKFVEAAKVAQEAYADALIKRAPQVTENLGFVERAARGVATWAKKMWDAILDVGREQTADERIKEVRDQIKALEDDITARKGQRSFTPAIDATNKAEIADKQALVDRLKEELKLIERKRSFAAGIAADAAKEAAAAKDLAEQDKKQKFDAVAYLIGLQEKVAADGFAKINLQEQAALRLNDKRLKDGEISFKTHQAAKLLILAEFGRDRALLETKLNNDVAEREERLRQKIQEIEEKNKKRLADGRELARGAIAGGVKDATGTGDEIAKLQVELEAKTQALKNAANIDEQNAALYAQAIVSLEQQTWDRIREIRNKARTDEEAAQSALLTSYGGLFGSLADLTESFGSRQSGAYKVLFAVSKAFAIADSIIKIQQGIANAAALPYPANLGAMASVVAATASIVSTISSVQFGGGRQYGGPVDAGSLYRVNEAGRPEMFTASNGAQYMLPTAGGRVDNPAGGGVSVQVQVINQHPTAEVSVTRGSDGQSVQIAVLEVASQIRENSGPVWSALRGATNVQGRF